MIVYSKQNCPACTSAKNLLTSHGIDFKVINIDEDAAAKEMILAKGFRQVPQISIAEGEFIIGGYPTLMKMSKEDILNYPYKTAA